MQFLLSSFQNAPKAQCCTGRRKTEIPSPVLTHAVLFTCLCYSRSSGGFCGDKSEWHIFGFWELHPLRLRKDGSHTPQDIVSPCSVPDSELYSVWVQVETLSFFQKSNVLNSCRFLTGGEKSTRFHPHFCGLHPLFRVFFFFLS